MNLPYSRYLLPMWLVISLPLAHGQWTKTMGQRGFTPGAPFDIKGLDSVNMANGNLLVTIPITSMAPGKAGHSIDLNLTYNSAHWDTRDEQINPIGGARIVSRLQDNLSWSGPSAPSVLYALVVESREYVGNCNTQNPSGPDSITPPEGAYSYRTRIVLPDGSQHVLYPASVVGNWLAEQPGTGWTSYDPAGRPSPCLALIPGPPGNPSGPPAWITGPLTYYTRDGTYMRLVTGGGTSEMYPGQLPWTLYLPDGRKIEGVGEGTTGIFDRNSNKISVNLNPTQPCFTPAPNTDFFTLTHDAFPTLGCIQVEHGSNSHDYVRQKGGDGNDLVWDIETGSVPISFSYKCINILPDATAGATNCSAGGTITVVKQIDMYWMTCGNVLCVQSYKFTYDNSTGNLTKIDLPTGGAIRYEYDPVEDINDVANQFTLYKRHVDYQDFADGSPPSHTTEYTISLSGTSNTVKNPDQGTVTHYFHAIYTSGVLGGRVFRVQQPDGSSVEKFWFRSPPNSTGTWTSDANPLVKREIHTAGTGSSLISAVKDFDTDLNGNVREVREYDWTASSIPHPQDAPSNNPNDVSTSGLTLTRRSFTSYHLSGPSSSDVPLSVFPTPTSPSIAGANEYWHAPANLLTAPSITGVFHSEGAAEYVDSYATFTYDDYRFSGNLLEEWHWDDTKQTLYLPLDASNAILTRRTYLGGDVEFEYDPNGRATRYQYGTAHPYPTDLFEAYTTAEERHWQFTWDTNTGLRLSERDFNNSVTTSATYDIRGRIKSVSEGNGARVTYTYYDDAARTITVKAPLNSASDQQLQIETSFDQLGRRWRTRNLSQGIETREFTRETNGATYQLVSNPFVTQTDATMGWTRTKLDTSGRIVEVTHYTGGDLPSPWTGGTTNTNTTGAVVTSYGTDPLGTPRGTTQLVTDEAGKQRTLVADGLGRLVKVVEAGTNTTTYTYNGTDHLTGVNQSGQIRTFAYSTLGRLTSATNPETGTISYTYDNNGNLRTRTDARPAVATMTYDSLNRVTSKSYIPSTNTPAVAYCYDGQIWSGSQCTGSRAAPFFGRLTEERSSVSSTQYTNYDALGRVAASQQTTGSTYAFTYQYKLNDALAKITYPSGRVVEYGYDGGGRITRVARGLLSGQDSYANGIAYAPQGAILSMTLGQLIEQHCYNARLQPLAIRVGGATTTACINTGFDKLNLGYTYSADSNNGNITTQVVQRLGQNSTQKYAYDGLNRLVIAAENPSTDPASSTTCQQITSNWCQKYGYDPYGNRWLSNPTGLPPTSPEVPQTSGAYNPPVSPPPGQVCAPNPTCNKVQSFNYDNAGNVTAIPDVLRTFDYDVENRQWRATINGTSTTYGYDGEGRRVTKTAGSLTTVFVYDAMGNLAAEYNGPLTPIDESGTRYLVADHLGSTRLLMNASGSEPKQYDYLPFGEEISTLSALYPQPAGPNSIKFTSKERDAETGLDYFGARYFSAAQGRFTSPDTAGPDLTNPQTFNKYRYALNNPLRYIDRNGLYEEDVHRDLTYALALAAGFNDTAAWRTASADQYVDDSPITNPWPPHGLDYVNVDRDYHFTTAQRRADMWSAFEATGSPEDLGTYLHTEQDSFSHAGFGPVLGHVAFGHAPDKTYNDPQKADAMALDTFTRLVSANLGGEYGGKYSALTYKAISPFVQQFNRARTDKQKQRALQQIRDAAQRNIEEQKRREAEKRRTGVCAAEFSDCTNQ